jgi:hypothetical protein
MAAAWTGAPRDEDATVVPGLPFYFHPHPRSHRRIFITFITTALHYDFKFAATEEAQLSP